MPFLEIQLVLAAWMTGVVWLVQMVVYPQMARVGVREFPAYHRGHTSGISFVVIPVMVLELFFAAACWWQQGTALSAGLLGGVVAIWVVTGLVQVPLHQRLSAGYDAKAIRRLVRTNGLRTALWSLRLAALLLCLKLKDTPLVEFGGVLGSGCCKLPCVHLALPPGEWFSIPQEIPR
jgi:hypothetical protein